LLQEPEGKGWALELLDQKTGTVKCWYNGEGGYGFIHPDGGGDAVFVHHTSLAAHTGAKSLPEGSQVIYEVARRDKAGLWAKDVCIAD
jgi:CspA family cold shock protein